MKKLTEIELYSVSGGDSEDEMLPEDFEINYFLFAVCELDNQTDVAFELN
jgi:hypothetical protein